MSVEPTHVGVSAASTVAYVDTNVILSLLLDDPPDMAEAAAACFAAAQRGDVSLVVTPTVMAEVVWVLGSVYKVSRHDITAQLLAFVAAQGLSVEHTDEVIAALSFYRDRNIDFTDALLAAHSLSAGPAVVYSFDHHFDRIPGLQRRIPGQPSPRG